MSSLLTFHSPGNCHERPRHLPFDSPYRTEPSTRLRPPSITPSTFFLPHRPAPRPPSPSIRKHKRARSLFPPTELDYGRDGSPHRRAHSAPITNEGRKRKSLWSKVFGKDRDAARGSTKEKEDALEIAIALPVLPDVPPTSPILLIRSPMPVASTVQTLPSLPSQPVPTFALPPSTRNHRSASSPQPSPPLAPKSSLRRKLSLQELRRTLSNRGKKATSPKSPRNDLPSPVPPTRRRTSSLFATTVSSPSRPRLIKRSSSLTTTAPPGDALDTILGIYDYDRTVYADLPTTPRRPNKLKRRPSAQEARPAVVSVAVVEQRRESPAENDGKTRRRTPSEPMVLVEGSSGHIRSTSESYRISRQPQPSFPPPPPPTTLPLRYPPRTAPPTRSSFSPFPASPQPLLPRTAAPAPPPISLFSAFPLPPNRTSNSSSRYPRHSSRFQLSHHPSPLRHASIASTTTSVPSTVDFNGEGVGQFSARLPVYITGSELRPSTSIPRTSSFHSAYVQTGIAV